MIIAIDVYYTEGIANAAAVAFKGWKSEDIITSKSIIIDKLHPYISGEFYKRELPCIIEVLNLFNKEEIDIIIIDGYVTLGDNKPGLGAYLYKTLEEKIPIIGVAKKEFLSNTNSQIKVIRGKSTKPLFVTSMGIDLQKSANKIQQMKGGYRIPDLLKLVDKKSRVFRGA